MCIYLIVNHLFYFFHLFFIKIAISWNNAKKYTIILKKNNGSGGKKVHLHRDFHCTPHYSLSRGPACPSSRCAGSQRYLIIYQRSRSKCPRQIQEQDPFLLISILWMIDMWWGKGHLCPFLIYRAASILSPTLQTITVRVGGWAKRKRGMSQADYCICELICNVAAPNFFMMEL